MAAHALSETSRLLIEANGFDADALEANRSGSLTPAQACRVVPDDSPNCPSAARRLVLRLLQLLRLLAQALVEVQESAKRRRDVRHLPGLPAFAA